VGRKLGIIAPWCKTKFPGRIIIKIYPQMAFGTGTHPTTQACLLFLAKLVRPGDIVLDLGTGSGILAIAAVKLGAGSVLAVDTDTTVKENVLKNVKLNRVENKIKLKIGRLANLQLREQFDLAVANLTGREILEEFDNLKHLVKQNGYIVISGWTKEDQKELIDYLKNKRVEILELKVKTGWVTAICRK
jgi:ribosomal protein L11 methyltransferase